LLFSSFIVEIARKHPWQFSRQNISKPSQDESNHLKMTQTHLGIFQTQTQSQTQTSWLDFSIQQVSWLKTSSFIAIDDQEKMGLSWAAAKSIISVALTQCGHAGHIDLDALSEHNKIEHDASLSRSDAFVCAGRQVQYSSATSWLDMNIFWICDFEQAEFNPSRFAKLLSFSKDGLYLTSDDVAEARAYFVNDSRIHNPEFNWSNQAQEASMIETSILLNVMGRNGKISLQDARAFFVDERFPDGWEKPPSYGLWSLNTDRSKSKSLFEAHLQLRGQPNIHSSSQHDD
jgi:hypothetical protein